PKFQVFPFPPSPYCTLMGSPCWREANCSAVKVKVTWLVEPSSPRRLMSNCWLPICITRSSPAGRNARLLDKVISTPPWLFTAGDEETGFIDFTVFWSEVLSGGRGVSSLGRTANCGDVPDRPLTLETRTLAIKT